MDYCYHFSMNTNQSPESQPNRTIKRIESHAEAAYYLREMGILDGTVEGGYEKPYYRASRMGDSLFDQIRPTEWGPSEQTDTPIL